MTVPDAVLQQNFSNFVMKIFGQLDFVLKNRGGWGSGILPKAHGSRSSAKHNNGKRDNTCFFS